MQAVYHINAEFSLKTSCFIRVLARFVIKIKVWRSINFEFGGIIMRHTLIRWIILAIAIAVTAWLMPGVQIHDNFWVSLIIIAAVYGLVNAIIRPIIMLFTCPLIILTLGLFTLVINALMLSLTDWLLPNLLTVDGFWTTFFAALIISIVSGLLGMFVHDDNKQVTVRSYS